MALTKVSDSQINLTVNSTTGVILFNTSNSLASSNNLTWNTGNSSLAVTGNIYQNGTVVPNLTTVITYALAF